MYNLEKFIHRMYEIPTNSEKIFSVDSGLGT